MPIKADCSSCGHSFKAASKFAGKKVKCPNCKDPLTIPAATKSGASAAGKIAVKCECGQKFSAKPEWAGKKVKCPGCSKPIRIPSPGAKPKSAATPPPPVPEASLGGLFDEVGFNTEDGSAHKKCPECRAAMSDDAIICIDCGYNESTGKQMETYRPVTAADRAKRAEKEDPALSTLKSKKKKKSGFAGSNISVSTPMIAAGFPILMFVAAVVANLISPDIGGMVFFVAIVVTLLMSAAGGLWLLSIAFADSVVQGLLCMFVPMGLYSLFYVATHWEETKDACLLNVIPAIVLFAAIFAIAPMMGLPGA